MQVEKSSHKEEHLGSSVFITDIVIGMADGLTVPFALAAGLSDRRGKKRGEGGGDGG